MHDPALSGLLNMDAEPVREFFREAPVMMHAIDGQGRLVAVTSYWAARLGYLVDEMIGRRSVDFLTPESRRLAELEVLPRLFRDGEIRKQPYDFNRKDGSVLSVLLSAVTLRDEDGAFDRALAFIVEDDGRDLLQRDLQSALLKAERATRSKAQFLAAMSHELRTPMNAILGFGQLLKLTELSAKQAAHVDAILTSGRQLTMRLAELLDLSQLEFADAALVRAETTTADLFDPLIAAWEEPVRAKGLGFVVDIDPMLPERVVTDRTRVQQVINNFLSNALRNTETGQISLRARQVSTGPDGVRIHVLVEDTGPGIEPDRFARIFQRFGDGDREATKLGGGWGFGLSICRSIADLMEAELRADTAPEQGAVFHFTFDAQHPGQTG